MIEPNWTNRTMWTGDNLDIMRGMNSESVDLIYLDPPFNSIATMPRLSAVRPQARRSKTRCLFAPISAAWGRTFVRESTLHIIGVVVVTSAAILVIVLFSEPVNEFLGKPGTWGLFRPTPTAAPTLVPPPTSAPAPTTTPTPVPNDEDKYVLWALYYGRLLRSDVNLLQESLELLYTAIELELEFEKTMKEFGMGTKVPKEGDIIFF